MSDLLLWIPPGGLMVLGAFLVMWMPRIPRVASVVLLPILSWAHLFALPDNHLLELAWLGQQLVPVRVDALSLVCLLYTSPSPRDGLLSRMPSSA